MRLNTYKNSDEELEEPDRLAPNRVPERQEQQDVGGRQEDAGPERECREQHAERDGRTQELGEVGADDGNLAQNVEWVESAVSNQPSVLRTVV